MKDTHTLELGEGERQAVLLALAHLSIERPGWDEMLNEIACRIDNVVDHRAKLYDDFRRLHTPVSDVEQGRRLAELAKLNER